MENTGKVHNTTQIWEKANNYQHKLEGVDKALFSEAKNDFQLVNFPFWISIIKQAREDEI